MQEPVFRVGEWLVIPADNVISRDGRQQTLEPRLIDILKYFALHPDVVLSRDELIDNVWKRNIVTNHVVTQCISELRKYLKESDQDNFEYIITVPKRGYKLAAPVIWCDTTGLLPFATSAAADERVNHDEHGEANPISSLVSHSLKSIASVFKVPFYRRSPFLVWLFCLVSLSVFVIFISVAEFSHRAPEVALPQPLNPRDIDIRLQGEEQCDSGTSQLSYATGLSELIANSLNTYSTYLVHDQTNYHYSGPSSSGKSLYIEFANQRHFLAQQCFLLVKLVDNADGSIMMRKRFFITNGNQLKIQEDFFKNISLVLNQPWPRQLTDRLAKLLPPSGLLLQRFYQAHELLIKGDENSLNQASAQLADIIKEAPDFIYASAEKALVDLLRNSSQPFDNADLMKLRTEINQLSTVAELKDSPIMQQIYTVNALAQGEIDNAYQAIHKGVALQMSWLNYVLLGKVYEMQGQNRLAADSYIVAFNLRPGKDTLHWIRTGVFQTSMATVVPYLDNYEKVSEAR